MTQPEFKPWEPRPHNAIWCEKNQQWESLDSGYAYISAVDNVFNVAYVGPVASCGCFPLFPNVYHTGIQFASGEPIFIDATHMHVWGT